MSHPALDGVSVKSAAFREFASTLCIQVVEQLCFEFEKEVGTLFGNLLGHRGELERCAELLGHQLHRERQLHETLLNVGDIQSSMVAHVEGISQRQPDVQAIHEMVDQMHMQQQSSINATLGQVNQHHQKHHQHLQAGQALQEPMITAQNEFNRILQLLQVPIVPPAPPAHIAGPVTPTTPRSAAPNQSQPSASMYAGSVGGSARSTTPQRTFENFTQPIGSSSQAGGYSTPRQLYQQPAALR